MGVRHDLGHGVYFEWLAFAPDRDLNPHLADLPDNDRSGIIVGHIHEGGARCEGAVLFDTPENQPRGESEYHSPVWQVRSLDPLTISPSILFRDCGFHGFIENGEWRDA